MGLRITNAMLLRSALSDVNRQRSRLADLQEKASSGLNINRPSDDPAGASAAILLRAGLDATAQFDRNVTQARSRVGVLEAALADTVDALIDAGTLASEGVSFPDRRAILATEVAALHARVLSAANSSSGGSYLFSGFSSDTAPFVASGPFQSGSPAPTVSFVGDSNEVQVPIDEGVTVSTGLDGRRVFLGDADGNGSVDPGAENVFEVLASLYEALVSDDQTAIEASLTGIQSARDSLAVERTTVGLIDTQLSEYEDKLADRRLRLTTSLSETQDIDAAEVFSALVNQETALTLALESAARMIQPSLLDFLG